MKLSLMENGKKIALFSAITLVIAALLLASNSYAKQLTIGENEIKQIKSVLDLTKIFSEIMVSDAKLKTILNLAIRGGETGTDITYGLLVLTALNEMDFIDMVVSQRYKTEADAYFNSVLDRRLNIAGYYKGTAFDIFRVLSNRISSPMAALTLSSFDITDKALEIFTELNILKKEITYDGLWRYFDFRKSNEPHKVAWGYARAEMGLDTETTSSFYRETKRNSEIDQLEPQFLALYEKWGPYVEINKGVKKEFKEQVKLELQNTLALAAEEQALAEKEKENKLSFLDKLKITLANLMKEANKVVVKIQELVGLGGAQVSQVAETVQPETVEPEPELTLDQMQEMLDDMAEEIDIIAREIEELTVQDAEQAPEEQEVVATEEAQKDEIIPVITEDQPPPPVVFNYGVPSPPPSEPEPIPQIFITEIQIETASSASYDFIELYNPATSSINLSGFQLKKRSSTGSESSVRLFPTGSIISAQNYFLWLNTDFASNSPEISADIISTQTLAKNNSIALFDKRDNLIDAVGWGTSTNPFSETASFPQNPGENQSLSRKWSTTTQNYIDTNNNQDDFEIQSPTPGARNQIPEPTPEPEPEPEPVPEPPSLLVMINEIAWAGTRANSADEWIELYNNTTLTIDLTGWVLSWSHGTTTHSLNFSTSSIAADDFYLLERTASDTTDVAEDQIYTGALSNDGEKLELRDAGNNLIDLVDFSTGWPAGSSTPYYISMERINATSGATSTNWASNNLLTRNGQDAGRNNINGTPRAQNSVSASPTLISGLPFDEFSEITLTKLGSPYIIQQSLTVPSEKTLIIEPGVNLKFDDSKEIEVRGDLKAVGSEAEKIIFERNSPEPPGNDRYRLHFIESQNSIIDNATFIDGGRLTHIPFVNPDGIISAAIEAENSGISIKNSSITGAFPRGVNSSGTTTIENTTLKGIRNSEWFLETFALSIRGENSSISSSTFKDNTIGMIITGGNPRIENNIFKENGTPIYLQGGDSSPIFLNNSAENNGSNGIVVDGANIIADTVWQSNLPYLVGSKYIAPGATLTLREGTIVKLGDNLIVSGRLITEGTLENPVVFTSGSDDEYGGDTNNDGAGTLPAKWDWQQIRFQSLATSSLAGARVRYGGGSCYGGDCYGAINLVSDTLEIKDSVIEKNIWGIFSHIGDCPTTFEALKLTNVVFSENDRDIALPYGVDCSPP